MQAWGGGWAWYRRYSSRIADYTKQKKGKSLSHPRMYEGIFTQKIPLLLPFFSKEFTFATSKSTHNLLCVPHKAVNSLWCFVETGKICEHLEQILVFRHLKRGETR